MATTQDFIEFVCDQINGDWRITYKKMFGEYMIYANEKPVLLVCDNTVFVKKLECIQSLASTLENGTPYKGAKEHYIIDIDNKDLLSKIIFELEKIIPIPVKKKPKNTI